ncbi:hypothetical protein RHSIM_Rhsim03G0044300 [Rhododendron simsii]|uniref:PGG domain-containing protein n=1 Tax=Rhododendron simsii TaxID=118357 RepID=A0A834LQ50_RHOSS|nr:hypothetical protein RHSIM_Rhsim03G0044300 [Rhododendron simsii]
MWMKDTATSCTIVSALIATMVFAAAITVPGGNDGKNGIPLLSKRKAFVIFGIFDAMALFSSITSVLTFLVILTSRYAEEDFLYTLLKRLITGLITLFVSILFMMVAFGAILYLVFGDSKAWILVPVVALASVPVALFGALQFPLLVAMIKSTYGRGIFGKQKSRCKPRSGCPLSLLLPYAPWEATTEEPEAEAEESFSRHAGGESGGVTSGASVDLIHVVASASIPVTLFGALQFPHLVEMIQSTYGRRIFGKQSDHHVLQ